MKRKMKTKAAMTGLLQSDGGWLLHEICSPSRPYHEDDWQRLVGNGKAVRSTSEYTRCFSHRKVGQLRVNLGASSNAMGSK